MKKRTTWKTKPPSSQVVYQRQSHNFMILTVKLVISCKFAHFVGRRTIVLPCQRDRTSHAREQIYTRVRTLNL